jgi:hypothetical protein
VSVVAAVADSFPLLAKALSGLGERQGSGIELDPLALVLLAAAALALLAARFAVPTLQRLQLPRPEPSRELEAPPRRAIS